MELYPNIYRTLTAGPVVELRGYAAACRLPGRLYAYLDYNGPTGTARDGLAEGMLALAAQRKVLAPGQTLIEAGSGAFAAALALAGRTSGHPVCLAMPDNTPAARQEKLSALGAQLLFSPAREGTAGARALAQTWAGKRGWYYTDWLACDDNPEYHRRVTGPQILKAAGDSIDAVVIGVGSGGTITGVGRYLKSKNPAVRVVGVEPATSAVLSGGAPGRHDLQGLGAGFVPKVLDTSIYDEIIRVADEDAYAAGRRLGREEGVLAGISSGAAVWAAIQLARRPENKGKTIVTLLPDTGDRYLSTKMFAE